MLPVLKNSVAEPRLHLGDVKGSLTILPLNASLVSKKAKFRCI
jgi:hypothetical protein